ncbi:MAG: ABC transporter substrate-binding protein, partial [Pseudomonadota bacterium]
MKKTFASAIAITAALTAGQVAADGHGGPVKIGVLATLEGTYTALGEDGVRGLRTALVQAGEKAGGRDIELIIQSTDASPDSAVRGARKLVEGDGVEIGPADDPRALVGVLGQVALIRVRFPAFNDGRGFSHAR